MTMNQSIRIALALLLGLTVAPSDVFARGIGGFGGGGFHGGGLAAATLSSLLVTTGSAQLFRRPRQVPVAPVVTSGPVTEKDALETGIEAYIYGYPLVTVEMTRRVMTNVAAPEGTHAPMGQFANLREYPTAAFKDVTAPNADTLYWPRSQPAPRCCISNLSG
jgi:hypothetical protein